MRRVKRIVDIKCPSSGESAKNHWPNMDVLSHKDEAKFVIGDRADFDWACDILEKYELDKKNKGS